MNDEEKIEEFAQPPKIVKVADIKVCIIEVPARLGTFYTFLYAYPYKDFDGGKLEGYNPTYGAGKYGEEIYPNKLLLWQAYISAIRKALRNNPVAKVLYEGKILRDDYYEPRRP